MTEAYESDPEFWEHLSDKPNLQRKKKKKTIEPPKEIANEAKITLKKLKE